MLRICSSAGCTTIVFGEGTCVEHDERGAGRARRRPTEVTVRPDPRAEAAESQTSGTR